MNPEEKLTEANTETGFEEIDPLKQGWLTEGELADLEEEILEKVRAYYAAIEASDEEGEKTGYLPQHSRSLAIIEKLHQYTVQNYSFAKYGRGEYGLHEYGMEIFETCASVLKSYRPESGNFIHYYKRSVAFALRVAQGKKTYEETHQGTMPESKVRTIARLVRTVKEESAGSNVSIDRVMELAAEEKKRITRADVIEYRLGDQSIDESLGDEADGMTFGERYLEDENWHPERVLFDSGGQEGFEQVVILIDEAYLQTQERQRGYMSEALTARLSEAVARIVEDDPEFMDILESASWFDRDTFDVYRESGERVLQKEIARKNEITEEALSNAMRRFIDRLGR